MPGGCPQAGCPTVPMLKEEGVQGVQGRVLGSAGTAGAQHAAGGLPGCPLPFHTHNLWGSPPASCLPLAHPSPLLSADEPRKLLVGPANPTSCSLPVPC